MSRQPLDKSLRAALEKTVVKAREVAELAATEVVERLGVGEANAPTYLDDAEVQLRKKLRAHGRQLGDTLNTGANKGEQETRWLIREIAYSHWHRMLFARFLEQNNLLMYDAHTPVTLDECAELAEDDGYADAWEMAAVLAAKMLPQVFRPDSPVYGVHLAINHIRTLEDMIGALAPETFQAQDSLGWVYQFWQNKRKEEVNKSEVKIGAKELSPVTQLFTEPYMVSFLLDNALGAWWANRRLTDNDKQTANTETELRQRASIDGVPLEYLRFVKTNAEGETDESGEWTPAAGTFDQWPNHLSELKTLDPCCGSGHFLVAAFLMLVPMRMMDEDLSAQDAVDAVLSQNIHGLELDQRCVELAAFALALEAWRFPDAGGYRVLPELHLACSGLSINQNKEKWLDLANGEQDIIRTLEDIYNQFENAPVLGSLIDPKAVLGKDTLFARTWSEVEPILTRALQGESSYEKYEVGVKAKGVLKAGSLLSGEYHLVATNVPYLGQKKYSNKLKAHILRYYEECKSDLALVFTSRISKLLSNGGVSNLVLPQGWLIQSNDHSFRELLLKKHHLKVVCTLGSDAFTTSIGAQVMLLAMEKKVTNSENSIIFIDASIKKGCQEKSKLIKELTLVENSQNEIISNDRHEIISYSTRNITTIGDYADSLQGLSTGEKNLFERYFWEFSSLHGSGWEYLHETSSLTQFIGGRCSVILWENEKGRLAKLADSLKHLNHSVQSWRRGKPYWHKRGIAVNRMGSLHRAFYSGDKFSVDIGVISPHSEKYFMALYAFCMSEEFVPAVRGIYSKPEVPMSYLVNIPFEFEKWNALASSLYPRGLPGGYTFNPTQWIFHGHPCGSVIWDEESKWTIKGDLRVDDTVLQVAVARLLGYQWPSELDTEMELAEDQREWVNACASLNELVDDDGIACLPAIRGEKAAADRLEALLQAAYGEAWNANVLNELLASVKAKSLKAWLRDKFFDQHSKLFQHRPFIWQIWDGQADGFSALVNYHQFDNAGLQRLIYVYLDDWIRLQNDGVNEGVDGADIRLTAAVALKDKLEAILVGEKGLDIFVRWKSLAEQPIGWNPDLNDGVRLNIRPFLKAGDVGKKGAGVLRGKPNIHWKKDRGTDVESAPWFNLGEEYGEKLGSRINDHHLTLAEKQAARDAKED